MFVATLQINFHFISKYGAPIEGWAILFYVTHLYA